MSPYCKIEYKASSDGAGTQIVRARGWFVGSSPYLQHADREAYGSGDTEEEARRDARYNLISRAADVE